MGWLSHFKELERSVESSLPEKTLAVVRVDGKNFRSFTRDFVRPYDTHFADTMNQVAEHLCSMITGSLFAYVQSDEISVVFSDLSSEETQMWMGGRVEKMVSITAANATAKYMRVSPTEQFPIFDGRVHTLASSEEMVDYVRWRRSDARKNAITMAANTLHSHKFLMGKNTDERLELLKGTELEVLPDDFLYGRLITKHYKDEMVEYVDKRTGVTESALAHRSHWETVAATDLEVSKLAL